MATDPRELKLWEANPHIRGTTVSLALTGRAWPFVLLISFSKKSSQNDPLNTGIGS